MGGAKEKLNLVNKFSDGVERREAIELLQDCKELIILPLLGESGQLEVEVSGLEIMNDDQVNWNGNLLDSF